MNYQLFRTISIKNIGKVSYYISSDIHFVEDYGKIKEYGVAISCDRKDNFCCSFASVSHISDDKNFIVKLIGLLAKEQALPIHLNDIIEDLLS